MSPAYIRGMETHLPNAAITFDKLHVIAHASQALYLTRRAEQKRDPELKGLRWALLKDRSQLSRTRRADVDALLMPLTTKRPVCLQQAGSGLAVSKGFTRNPQSQTAKWGTRYALAMAHPRQPLKNQADESSRRHDPQSSGRHCRLVENPDEQWLSRSNQQSVRIPPIVDHPIYHLSHRRKDQLQQTQSSCALNHSKFKRAKKITLRRSTKDYQHRTRFRSPIDPDRSVGARYVWNPKRIYPYGAINALYNRL